VFGCSSIPAGIAPKAVTIPVRPAPAAPQCDISTLDSWVVGDEDGKSYLEQHLITEERFFTLMTFRERPRGSGL